MNFHRGLSYRRQRAPKSRRPQGVSRRQRKKQLGFETLEDRRVMSAQSPLSGSHLDEIEFVSYSSATPEGQLQILMQELQRYQSQSFETDAKITRAIPTDPLLGNQWHLINVGQQVGSPDYQNIFGEPGEDINVAAAWNLGYTGDGVVVAVVDSGVELLHPDLVANIHPTLQLDALDQDGDANPQVFAFDPDNQGPWLASFGNAHGTATAGLIAADDNGIGGTGVAHGAQIVPIRLIDLGQTEQATIDTFRFAIDQIDITNNSWGPSDAIRSLDGPTPNELLALRDSVLFGRDGLGVIHVWASGNGADATNGAIDSSSYDGYVSSRYTIGVTGVDHDGEYNNVDGTVTGYPETGASVLVAAPTGSVFLDVLDDTGNGSGLVTTDTTGNTGFNIDPDPVTGQQFDRDFLTDEAYVSRFNGTSGSSPIVAGVIALMLEANPHLGWRDVQEILLRSARQNSEFATQSDGLDKVFGIEFQNTWIINQMPLFHDPDLFDPLIPNGLQFFNPTLNPDLSFPIESNLHYAPTPQVLTNGAGYTVSQGRGTNFEQTGFAHGVVDAELAVQLAQQWNTKNQTLANELTFTTAVGAQRNFDLPAAETVAIGDVNLIIPGGLDGEDGFSAYWAEYFAAVPDFTVDFPDRAVPLELTLPSPNDMVVESVDISINIAGGNTDFLDNVRMVLVSPNGTHSELNHYFVDPSFIDPINLHQVRGTPILLPGGGTALGTSLLQLNGLDGVSLNQNQFIDPGSVDTSVGNLQFTFSTNRIWGERSDDALIFDQTTGEPVIDTIFGLGGNRINFTDPTAGTFLTQGWQLYMENYSTAGLALTDFEIAWHGSPISAATERVQGLIGIDDNRDDLFNYSRVIQQILQIDADPTLRLGEIQNLIDPDHETMASNVTVFAHRDVNANGLLDPTDILVDQFVTGADGNYYFDLVPDDYIFSLDQDSLGSLSALDDSLTAAGFVQDYRSQWAISTDYFQVWDYDGNLEVAIDAATNAPLALLDGNGSTVQYGLKNINFLLDPGAPAAQQVEFSGTITADFNGDGIFNGNDTVVPGINIFADVNRNEQFDAGELLTATDANGQYSLVVPLAASTVMNVGVIAPVDWTPSDPASGIATFFTQIGDVFTGVDFDIMPPVFSAGDGSNQTGILLGTVFDDINENTLRQTSEPGLANLTVYIDANNSGAFDPTELSAVTNANGAFVFSGIAPGNYNLRVDLAGSPELAQTAPVFNSPRNVTLNGNGTVTNIEFGVHNAAILDFGDLPAAYGLTLLSEDGARHSKGVYYLGARIDTELDGFPTAAANGDDITLDDDEDGVLVADLTSGIQAADATGTLTATASRYGGNLHAWIDFNGDFKFDGPGEHILSNHALVFGANVISFDLPDEIADTGVYARFRYGEFGLGLTGAAAIGEVEDYELNLTAPAIAPNVDESDPDFNGDGVVGGFDFLAWQRGFGATSGAAVSDGDANDDGEVNSDDLAEWGAAYGTDTNSAAVSVAPQTGDFNLDGGADGHDFLAWQRGFGTEEVATLAQGDGTQDGNVDANDLSVWSNNYGVLGAESDSGSASTVVAVSLSSGSLSAGAFEATPQVLEVSAASSSQVSRPAQAKVTTERSELPGIALAAHLRRMSTFGSFVEHASRVSRVVARYESQAYDTLQGRGTDPAELGIALRDEALDHLFAGRRHDWETLQREHDEADVAEEALASALSEEIDWRVG